MISEYGTSGKIRFLDAGHVAMYDTQGNIILCKCGKPAGAGVFGKEAFKVWCSDCDPMKDEPKAQFIYRPLNAKNPPNDEQ